MRRLLTGLALVALLGGALTGCRSEDRDLIALLLPDDGASRWELQDRPAFEEAVRAACVTCVVEVHNAGGDAATQRTQFEQARDDGADVIVLAAVDSAGGESMVQAAGETPVVAYDRFVSGADYYVSYDGSQVGTLQAQALLAASPEKPAILMLNGAVGDPGATAVKLAAHTVLDPAGVTVLAEQDPADGRPETAEAWATEQLRQLRGEEIDAVYAATDAEAEGILAAFGKAHRKLPVLTGQDAELSALQRIVTGEQTMTVYKSVPDEAGRAATFAVKLVGGRQVTGTTVQEGVPSVIFEPVAVDLENLTNTVVRDGVVRIDELCTSELLDACEQAGIA